MNCQDCNGSGHVRINISMRERDIDPPDCGTCGGTGETNALKQHILTSTIAQHIAQSDPEEFTSERTEWLVNRLNEALSKFGAGAFMAAAHDCADFAGGTVWTSTDVAQALYHPDQDEEPTDEEIDSITPEQLSQAAETMESYIFNGTYSWLEAMQDNVDGPGTRHVVSVRAGDIREEFKYDSEDEARAAEKQLAAEAKAQEAQDGVHRVVVYIGRIHSEEAN